MNASNTDSSELRKSDTGSTDRKRIGEHGEKRSVVLITGDSSELPLELGSLLSECGCSAFVTTSFEALNDAHVHPEIIMVNFASVQAADPQRVQALREKVGKPVVCLLPHPKKQQVAMAARLGADLLVFKPLCADEFKSRLRILLWEQRNYLLLWEQRISDLDR